MFIIGVFNLESKEPLIRSTYQQEGYIVLSIENAVELEDVQGLIISGYSTKSFYNFSKENKIYEIIKNAINNKIPIFGIGTGLLLISKNNEVKEINLPHMLNITVKYDNLSSNEVCAKKEVIIPALGKEALSIFAINSISMIDIGPNVGIFATNEDEIIMVRQGNYLGTSFYIDIADNDIILKYFIRMVRDCFNYCGAD